MGFGGLLPFPAEICRLQPVLWLGDTVPPTTDCSVLDEGVFPQLPLVLAGKGLSWEMFALIAFYSPLAGPGCPQAMVSAPHPISPGV